MTDREELFLSKLKLLLREYEASIGFDCADTSDLNGVYNEHILLRVDGKTCFKTSGFNLYVGDL